MNTVLSEIILKLVHIG